MHSAILTERLYGSAALKAIQSSSFTLYPPNATTKTFSLGANKYSFAVIGLTSVSIVAPAATGGTHYSRILSQNFNSTTGVLTASVQTTYSNENHSYSSMSYTIWGIEK